jgi:hypothetical protein
MAGGLGMSGVTEAEGEVAKLTDRLMSGIAERAGEWAAVRARLLLDHVIATVPREGLSDPSVFRKHLVEQAALFIQCSGGDPEVHFRYVGVNHLLVNMLQPLVEGTDDEYVTTEFEELRDGLDDLERIDVSNPSLNARLSSIFDELVELSMTLGVVAPTLPKGAQQKV